ncbi:class I glutamine amidotransferase-like protein [Schizothecium vesticola]|uniref:Class I glutamine amidotransferase-like protein n=1 Tax=Schizothecium vesticola TaxID=314040 RepID=A0AA40K335_9PEZI|nr:class I glutamine amidotransferase-like protein [Schizothecium vesticola]
MSPAPLRLAILEADTPLPGIDARYHGYYGVFTHLFIRAVAPAPLSSALILSRHDVVNADPPASSHPSLSDVDALLITGSKHSAFEDTPWILALVDLVRRALAHTPRLRVIGVCFGHQIVSRALGVPVRRADAGWEVSVTETRLTLAGQALFDGRETLKIQQMHRDQALGVPPGATLLASTDKCPNHGFVIPGRVITVQGHPEFTDDIMEEILETRHSAGLFDDELFRDGMGRRGEEHDGVLMAKVFLEFLRGAS